MRSRPAASPATDLVAGPGALTSALQLRPYPEPLLMTVEEAAEQLLIGRSLMYELIKEGRVATVRIGRLRRVPCEALRNYVEDLVKAAGSVTSDRL